MKRFIGILFFLIAGSLCHAQSVGVVLSGGGARGMAHIGVLKALEENNIPIDFIAGTSAGAIVGGLYAAGYTIEEITEFFTSGLIDSYLNPQTENYGYISKELKPTPEWFTVKFRLDSLFKFRALPTNLYSSDDMDFGFMTYFVQASTASKNDFDNLMIPFRCVASSISENKPYIIGKGDLGAAIRASMSFPFYFSPIKIDGKVLLDGGMYNNFPINIMSEDFKADYIIGCSVTSNFQDPDEGDIVSVLQNIFMLDVDFSMPENSVLIEPDVSEVSLLDFSHTLRLIDSGYNYCMRKMDTIKMNVKSVRTQEDLEYKRQVFNRKKPPLFFKNVYAANVNDKQRSYIENLLTAKREFLSIGELKEKYEVLSSLDNISRINPIAMYNDSTGLYDLYLNIKQEFNFEAKLGGNVSWGGINQAYFGLQYRYFNRFSLDSKFNMYFGNFYKSIGVEGKIDYPGNILIYSYIDLALNRKNYFTTSGNFYADASPSYLIQDEKHAQVRFGMPVFKRSEVYAKVAGVNTKDFFYNTNSFSSKDEPDTDKFLGMSLGLVYHKSTMNDYFYPDRGYSIFFSANYIFGNEEYVPGTTSLSQKKLDNHHSWISLDLKYEHFLLNKRKFSLGVNLRTAISTQKVWANYMSSLLHAKSFEPFQDSKVRFLHEYRAYNFTAVGAKFIYKLPLNFLIMLEGYTFTPFFNIIEGEDQKAEIGSFYDKTYYMASAGIVFRNQLVPVSLNFNFYNDKALPFTVSFTIGYTIFNSYGLE